MNERGAPAPVFVGSIRQKQLRNCAGGAFGPEQRVGIKRRNINRIQHIHKRVAIPGWLRKTFVKTAAAGTAYMRPDGIEYAAALFRGIESLLEQCAEKPPVL